jgi:hypothetical protein
VPEDENWSTDEDPGFVDPAAGDFRLRADSPVYTRLAGFRPLPLEQAGIRADGLRICPLPDPWAGRTPGSEGWDRAR